MWSLLSAVYGVFLAVDTRLAAYVLVASALVATAAVLGMKKLLRVRQMVLPGILIFLANMLILWLIFNVFLGYPLFQIQSVFELP